MRHPSPLSQVHPWQSWLTALLALCALAAVPTDGRAQPAPGDGNRPANGPTGDATPGEGGNGEPGDGTNEGAEPPGAGGREPFLGVDITIEDPDGSYQSWEEDVYDLEQPERLRRCRVFVVPHRFSIEHSGARIGHLRLTGDRLVIWQGLQDRDDNADTRMLEFYAAGNVRLEWERLDVPLADRTFVFAGDLGALTLPAATRAVRDLGGTVSREISQYTDYLVAGRGTPAHLIEAARREKMEVLEVADFTRLVESLNLPRESVVKRQSHLLRADEVFLSLTDGVRGVVSNARARLQHPSGTNFYLSARDIRILSVNDAIGTDAMVSITPFALPWLHVRARRLRWRQRENPRGSVRVINIEGTGVYLGNNKIAPMFDLDQNLDRSAFIRNLAFNQSDRFGFSLLTDIDFGLLVHDNILGKTFDDTTLTGRIVGGVNFHTSRGVAPWTRLSYYQPAGEGKRLIDGGVYAWYIHDSGDDTDFGRDNNFFPLERSDRLRARLWHHQEFPLGLALNFQMSFFSDQNLLQEFFRGEFDQQFNQDSYIDLTRYDPITGVRVVYQRQINNFDETIEYEPRLQFFLYPSKLFEIPFTTVPVYLKVGVDIAQPKFRSASDGGVANYKSTRLDLQPGLSVPVDLGFMGIGLDAFIGLSWYGWNIDLNDIRTPDRIYYETRASAFTHIFRTFSGRSDLFDVNGIRHVMRPEVIFVHRFPVDYAHYNSSSTIPQFDEIDSPLTGFDRVDFIFTNRIEGLRGSGPTSNRVVTLLDIRAEWSWFPNGSRDNSGETWGPLFGRLEFRPRPWLGITGDMRFDLGDRAFTRYGVGLEFVIRLPGGETVDRGFPDRRAVPPLLRFQLTHRIVQNASTISGFSAAWRASGIYTMQFYGEYDFRARNVRNLNIVVQRTFQEFILTFNVRRDFVREDTSVFFTFTPFVFGETTDVIDVGYDPTLARYDPR